MARINIPKAGAYDLVPVGKGKKKGKIPPQFMKKGKGGKSKKMKSFGGY